MNTRPSSQGSRHRLGRVALIAALALTGLVVALAGCTASTATSQSPAPTQGSAGTDGSLTLVDTITVNGVGKVLATPDRGVINVGVQTQAGTAAEALDKNSRDVEGLITRLKAEGVPAEGIRTSNLNVFPLTTYDPQTGMQSIQGYQAENTVTVTVNDISLLGKMLAAAAQAGGNFISGLELSLTDETKPSSEALAIAMANARTKAEAVAAAAGVKLGDVVSVRESMVAPAPVYYETRGAGTSDLNAVPVSAGQLQIEASVDVTFRISR